MAKVGGSPIHWAAVLQQVDMGTRRTGRHWGYPWEGLAATTRDAQQGSGANGFTPTDESSFLGLSQSIGQRLEPPS